MPLSEPIKAVVAEMGRRFAAEVKAMRAELAEELTLLRKATREHHEARERQVDDAVKAAIARVERDLRQYLDQRIDRAMADLIEDIGKRDRVKEPQ